MSTSLEVWLKENKLMAYESVFEVQVDDLNDLSCEVLETDQQIIDFIEEEIGETKKLKQKKILNAIKKLQAKLSEESDNKESEKKDSYKKATENVLSSEVSKRGYDISDFVGVTQEKEIEGVVENNKLLIVKQEKQFYEINVREAMEKLANCGSLIQLAYASTNGFKCQSQVVKLLSEYHTLVKHSYIASTQFVTSSMTALKFHKTALDIVLKKPELSIKFVMRCSDLAGKMSSVAGDLYKECEKLTNISKQALDKAVEDIKVSDQERENIQKQISEAKVAEVRLKCLSESINKQLNEVREDQAKGKTALQIACMLTQQKYEIQNKLISQNAELAKTLAQLQGYKGKENKLNRGLKSIEIAIKTLGKMEVIFLNTQLFWKGVEKHCNRLVQIDGDVELLSSDVQLFKEEIRDKIIESGLNWFTFCKVNYDAKQAIIQVDKGVDAILNNLPDENEAVLLVDQLLNIMIKELENENKQLKQITSDTDN